MLGRDMRRAGLLAAFLDHAPNRFGLARHSEGGEAGLWVSWIFHLVRAKALGEGFGDFLGVARGPHARAVNTATSAVFVNAVGHEIEIVLPLIHHVVAQ